MQQMAVKVNTIGTCSGAKPLTKANNVAVSFRHTRLFTLMSLMFGSLTSLPEK